jgi:hypothetical protein
MQPDNKKLDDDKIREILKDFEVSNEEEFVEKINKNWDDIKCIRCGRDIKLLECSFLDGDPICKGGCLG